MAWSRLATSSHLAVPIVSNSGFAPPFNGYSIIEELEEIDLYRSAQLAWAEAEGRKSGRPTIPSAEEWIRKAAANSEAQGCWLSSGCPTFSS